MNLPSRKELMQKYSSNNKIAIVSFLVSFVLFVIFFLLSYHFIRINLLVSSFFSIITSLFLVRLFTIQHDCGHYSFFTKKYLNDYVGRFCSIFTFIPYDQWKRNHNLHHAHSGNLDKQGVGNIIVYTVDEYIQLPIIKKIQYRIYRNTFFMFIFAPIILFLVLKRFPFDSEKSWKKERIGVFFTTIMIIILDIFLYVMLGVEGLILHLVVMCLTSVFGAWLFFVQHNFEHSYWQHSKSWSFIDSALLGSSYYLLPSLFRILLNNINIHHIHHYQTKIPSYKLNQCLKDYPCFQSVRPVTIFESVKNTQLSLWDERHQKMISFRELI